MAINIKHIIIGWGKRMGVFPTSDAEIKLADLRMKICTSCSKIKEGKMIQIKDGHVQNVVVKKCGVCSCPLKEKTIVINEKCPLEKW